MKKRKMYIRMIMASLLRRRSRMIIALLAISIGAMILSGLVTIYYDVPRQMGQQFRSYGANMILTSEGDSITQEQVEATKKLIPEDKLVGIAAYRYQTVRINDRPVMAAAADLEQVRKTSPFWLVEGEWPSKEGELMAGKNIARTYNLKAGNGRPAPSRRKRRQRRSRERRRRSFPTTGQISPCPEFWIPAAKRKTMFIC